MPSDRFAFIVRVWLEKNSSTSDSPQLRGSVQTASADTVRYFTSFDDLPHLLRELSNLDAAFGQNQPSTLNPPEQADL
ncbi:MAG: hypothetical protein R6X32_00535 [Chloroflexota bacterium]|jgi:hypothetical protein